MGCYNKHDYFCTLSTALVLSIVLETGYVSILRYEKEEREKVPTQLGPYEQDSLNHWSLSYRYQKMETDQFPKCHVVIKLRKWTMSKNNRVF
jgi:hypothetical protein